jgi:hypothetical protein
MTPKLRLSFIFALGLGVALLLGVVGCKEKAPSSEPLFAEAPFETTSKTFLIPRDLKKTIDKEYVAFIKRKDPGNIDSEEKITSLVPRGFLSIQVKLNQLVSGTLRRNIVFKSPRGGGLVDLAEEVVGTKGTFFVRFSVDDPEVKEGPLEDIKVYFLSRAPERVIDKETYGSGCGRLSDITSLFEKMKSGGEGIRTNATDDRYLYTLTGDYFFVGFVPGRIFLASLQLVDRKKTLPPCEPGVAP